MATAWDRNRVLVQSAFKHGVNDITEFAALFSVILPSFVFVMSVSYARESVGALSHHGPRDSSSQFWHVLTRPS